MSIYDFRVYCHIHRRGSCYESVPAMGKHLRLDARTVRKSLAVLHTHKLVTSTERTGQTTIHTAGNPLHAMSGVAGPNPSHPMSGDPSHGMSVHPPHGMSGKGNPLKVTPLKGSPPLATWQLSKDLERLDKQISAEKNKTIPNAGKLAALIQEKKKINAALSEQGQQRPAPQKKQVSQPIVTPEHDGFAGATQEQLNELMGKLKAAAKGEG